MEMTNIRIAMRKAGTSLLLGSLAVCGGMFATSCDDDVDMNDESFYTFTGQTASSFCHEDGRFTIFSQLLDDTGTAGLLSTYGYYTLFAPTDEAMEAYFTRNGISYASLTDEEKSEMVFNHVVKSLGVSYTSDYFEEGSLPEPTMSDNYITVSYDVDALGSGLTVYLNKNVPVIEKDVEVHNGVVHVVGNVIVPATDFITDVLEQNETTSFSLFAQALRATGFYRAIEPIRDESYVAPYPDGELTRGESKFQVPTVKRYGFTVFAEPDEVFANAGITTIEELASYAETYYGTENRGDYTSENNALHKFVAYHILDRQMGTNEFLYSGSTTVSSRMNERCEYYETMLTYRLMEIKAGNRINYRTKTRTCVGINEAESNLSAVNGFAHCLDAILVYDEDVMVNEVLNKRIRFDFYNIPPELTNNNIRWKLMNPGYSGYVVPNDFCGEHLQFSDETQITMWSSEGWTNFEEDELKLNGWYDFTLRMLPMPPGSYEVRIGYRQESWRGIAQLFVDGEIQGIPRDLRISGTDPMVGWIDDTENPAVDSENDKSMRNRGYMKAPASIYTPQAGGVSLRRMSACLRIIVGQFTWQEYGPHFLRGKNVYDPNQEFHGDYIEIIPVSQIDKEDIY